ncbi:hypothetical protein FA15DRAFT_709805 [Coprinopsis marcescibilis]|uniref:Uncharacterized protein n=1 Tax=Coprinopsis marcescibilis TaxID=230819 RepID=A0A5C3KF31_COPMA|nr:hypothetical protein FA15DRAFT_709805 [Coprinopsis marcescibilis]
MILMSVADNLVLNYDTEIPVYDACGVRKFDISAVSLSDIDSSLKRWKGKVPVDSVVVVGYTISVFMSRGGHWTLGCNIQWAIVLLAPSS